jgi:hypothetical protein
MLFKTIFAILARPAGIDKATNAGKLIDFELLHTRTDLCDASNDLMSRYHRKNPRVPFITHLVKIGMTNTTVEDLDLNIILSGLLSLETPWSKF